MAEDAPYQSLYRRFRPQTFAEVRGQDHITRALRNAVREGRVAHAYLFSGPRGTGKTSTARVLAKALNCTDLQDGEPCNQCQACIEIRTGSSLDVQELDAASNNGVDAMRDLVARAALGNPGRRKVYIVDEVHMLSAAASNALLKTLEEPPAHVVFVLATTDPQKVLPTIRSRTQHYEFRLLSGDVLAGLLNEINQSAALGVSPEAIDLVMRRGSGSARDALSVLDQVAAAGDMAGDEGVDRVAELVEAVADRDAGRGLLAIAESCSAGLDPRRLATDVLEHLRNAFLMSMKAAELVAVPDVARDRLAEQAARLGPAGLTRAMEALGQAVIDMRDALDPRITLEVAVVRLARPEADTSPAALLERIERLERGLSGHVTEPARAEARATVEQVVAEPAPNLAAPPPASVPSAGPAGPAGPAGAKAALGALRQRP
ncbi:MAG: polymerase subunit gamma/tau, partial [Acidimicrobiaceae bacterium]|nr:polymerase subunit gamma/tau [Acidimicrobiaceae bacterium]